MLNFVYILIFYPGVPAVYFRVRSFMHIRRKLITAEKNVFRYIAGNLYKGTGKLNPFQLGAKIKGIIAYLLLPPTHFLPV